MALPFNTIRNRSPHAAYRSQQRVSYSHMLICHHKMINYCTVEYDVLNYYYWFNHGIHAMIGFFFFFLKWDYNYKIFPLSAPTKSYHIPLPNYTSFKSWLHFHLAISCVDAYAYKYLFLNITCSVRTLSFISMFWGLTI